MQQMALHYYSIMPVRALYNALCSIGSECRAQTMHRARARVCQDPFSAREESFCGGGVCALDARGGDEYWSCLNQENDPAASSNIREMQHNLTKPGA